MKVLKIILLCHYSKKYIESFGFGWRNPLSGQNNLLFSLALCDIFFYRHPEGIARNCEEFIPFHSLRFLADIFFKIFAIFLARLNLIAYLYHRYDIYVEHSTSCRFANWKYTAVRLPRFFLPLVVDHMYVVADEEVRSAFFRTLSSTAPDGIIHWALSFCSRLLLMWSSMMRLRRILPVVGQNAVKEM